MSDHAPPGTPANDDERTRLAHPPSGDPDATIIPGRPPPPNPPLYGSAPPQPPPRPPAAPVQPPQQEPPRQQPPAAWNTSPGNPPVGPTAPYPTTPPTGYPGASAPPPYGGGYPPQPPPPAYGGTQPLPQPPYGGYQQPPPYGGGYGAPYGYPPPVSPRPKSKRGLVLGLVGGVLALLAIVGGLFLFTNKGGSDTATATPARTAVASAAISTTTPVALVTQAGGGSILATLSAAATGTAGPAGTAAPSLLATSTAAPTRAPATATTAALASRTAVASASRPAVSPTVGQGGLPPTPTGSARPGTPVATTTANLGQTWTDPNGRLKVQYPNDWTVTKVANSQSNIVEFDGPDGVSFYVDVYKQSGTPAEEMKATTDARDKSTQFTFTNSPITDAKVGGEPGKAVSFVAKRKDQTTGTGTDGTLWIVNHGSSEYDFEALSVGKHRPEIDAILATVVFTG